MKVTDNKIMTEEELEILNSSFSMENMEVPEEILENIGEVDLSFLVKDRLLQMNRLRNNETKKIIVEILDNIILNGDEKSQERISRAISVLDPEETTFWIDANGEAQELTRESLKEALKLAGQKQTEIFVEYAQKKAELVAA